MVTPLTTVVKCMENLGSFLRDGSAVTVVMDPALRGSPAHEWLTTSRLLVGAQWVDLPSGAGGMEAARAVAEQVSAGGWCLALGGGTTMDTVKVARMLSARFPLQDLTAAEMVLDGQLLASRPWRMVALPTTIGTASEVSAAAVVRYKGQRVLLRGPGLRPEVACLDPRQTQTLPSSIVVSGAVEAMFRTVFPYLASPTTPAHDSAVHAVAAALLRRIRSGTVAPLSAEARQELAELSQCSQSLQSSGLHRGRDPHGFKLWPINHEVSALANLPKIMTMSALAPRVLERIEQGDVAWGSAQALDDLMRSLERLLPSAGGTAERWVSLMEECSLPTSLPSMDVDGAVQLIMDRWGAPRPALAGLGSKDVHDLLSSALERSRV